MRRNIIQKCINRLWRIITFRKGVYGTIGRKNRFRPGIYMNERTSVGSYNYFGERVVLFNVRVGNYCSIANSAKLGELEHDLNCVSTSTHIFGPKHGVTDFTGIQSPTILEDDVWIGSNAVVLQGVTIHRGAVVGAGAVVTKDIPPYGIAVGVPAKVIKYRFESDIIQRIEDSKWWELDKDVACRICNNLQKLIK